MFPVLTGHPPPPKLRAATINSELIVRSKLRAKRNRNPLAKDSVSTFILYSQPGCSNCRAVKRQLDKHNIPHQVLDITDDDQARDRIVQAGYQSTPVFHIPNSGLTNSLQAALDYIRAGKSS